MKHVTSLLLGLLLVVGVQAQQVFKHTATSSNTNNNWTTIDHPSTNNNPNAILVVTSDYGTTGPYVNKSLGVWYYNNRWNIFYQDQSAMARNAIFNVMVAEPASNAFIHQATGSSISGSSTLIDRAGLNGVSTAKLLVTQNYGTSGPYNNRPLGVYYFNERWIIRNLSGSTMPLGAKFNVIRVDEAFTATSNTITSNWFTIENAFTNDNPNALVFVTRRGSDNRNPKEVGVWYNGGNWHIFNQDRAAMPQNITFNVAAFGGDEIRPPAPIPSGATVVSRDDWFRPLDNILRTAFIRINNYTPNQNEFNATGERAFLLPGDSFFRMRAAGRDIRMAFNIDMIEGGPDNRCKAYINDWNTNSASSAVDGGRLRVLMSFENAGIELVTNCYNNACCEGNPFCPGAGCPDYELNNAAIDLFLTPVMRGNRLSYTSEVNFRADVGELGDDPCTDNFWAFLCDWDLVPRRGERQNMIRNAIQTEVRNQLDAPAIRAIVEGALAAAMPEGEFSDVRIDGDGNLVFTP
ncbi:MAG: hypothetical protein KTR13_04570 [Saprospiraceae bacterium]|nr:hypothetical protein [Saprospiraceae bacterium]